MVAVRVMWEYNSVPPSGGEPVIAAVKGSESTGLTGGLDFLYSSSDIFRQKVGFMGPFNSQMKEEGGCLSFSD